MVADLGPLQIDQLGPGRETFLAMRLRDGTTHTTEGGTMHAHDYNTRRLIARERAAELARDWHRAQKAAEPDPWQSEIDERAVPLSLLNRLLRRTPAQAAEQRP